MKQMLLIGVCAVFLLRVEPSGDDIPPGDGSLCDLLRTCQKSKTLVPAFTVYSALSIQSRLSCF